MLLNYIKIALRNIARHKVYSLINVVGLAIGLAVVILISLSIGLECSYDNFHVNKDRIFRVSLSNFFNLFDFNLILGDPESALTSPSSIVLTRETARKFFGDSNPIEKIIHDNNHRPLVVVPRGKGLGFNPGQGAEV